MSCKFFFHKHVRLYSEYMPTLHWWIGASSVSPYVMTVTWWTASGIIIHHWSNAYELSIYWFTLIYFPAATVTITTKYQKHYFWCLYFCCRYHHYHITVLLNTLLQILSFQVWLNWQLNCLYLRIFFGSPCVESINLGWILYPRKLLRSPILVGYQVPRWLWSMGHYCR